MSSCHYVYDYIVKDICVVAAGLRLSRQRKSRRLRIFETKPAACVLYRLIHLSQYIFKKFFGSLYEHQF